MIKMFEGRMKSANASLDMVKIVTPMVDAVAQMGRTVLQNAIMMREATQEPPQEGGLMDVIKAAIGAWAEASARNSSAPPAMPDPRLAPAAAQASPPPVRVPTGPPVPAQTAQTAEPEPETDEEVTPSQMVDMLAQAIRDHTPPDDLAPDIVEALGAPEFVEAIKADGGVLAALGRGSARVGSRRGEHRVRAGPFLEGRAGCRRERCGRSPALRCIDTRRIGQTQGGPVDIGAPFELASPLAGHPVRRTESALFRCRGPEPRSRAP
jgi:hypothetical protein